ncbi:MAG: hypothetical protein IT203_09860 [Fimbriimonadaceae bacterium]|nr:hypothetical protein [Fimbriimonadaceae bacterium]
MLAALAIAVTFHSVDYTVQSVQGWTLHIRNDLRRDLPKDTEAAIRLLRIQLQETEKKVPGASITELKKVQLWFSPEYPGISPRAEYHPSGDWLRENKRSPEMAKGIEFTNIRIFETESRRMPNFALHELAHAYQDRVLTDGFRNKEIESAYAHAQGSGVYDKVSRKDSNGKVTQERAYALTNPMEYFAEGTEAFFSRNDFFPFTRADLERVDPELAKLLAKVWGATSRSK